MKNLKLFIGYVIASSIILCTVGCGNKVEKDSNVIDALKQENVDVIKEVISHMYKSGASIQLSITEDEADDMFLVYNSDGDAYAESNDGMICVYQHDREAILFSVPVERLSELSALNLLERSLNLVEEGKGSIEEGEFNINDLSTESNAEDISKYIREFTVTIGKDNIANLSNDNTNSLGSIFGYNVGENATEVSEIVFIVTTDMNENVSCVAYFTIEDEQYIAWVFDGVIYMGDWGSLPKDFDKCNTDEEWTGMINKVQESMAVVIEKFLSEME